jgi:hypothetical protein
VRARSILLLALSLASCARRAPPPDLSLDPDALLAQVREAAGRVTSVRGQARVRVEGAAGGAVAAFVAAQRPDRLHLEALDFFGNPAAVLATGDGRLAIYDARDRRFYRGGATAENVGRLVPLALPPEDLVAVLCGAPPLGGEAMRAEPGPGYVTLELRDGARTTTLRVRAGAAVARASVRAPGGAYEVTYGLPGSVEGTMLPGDITVSSDRPKVRVQLGWVDFEANAPLEAALFRLEPPAGARVVELGAPGAPLPASVFPEPPP